MKVYIILCLLYGCIATNIDKTNFCQTLNCKGVKDESVCGLRAEGKGFRLKLFINECELMKYGCSVHEELAYGLINKEYCDQSFADFNGSSENNEQKLNSVLFHASATGCEDYECINGDTNEVCAIRQDGGGYIIRLFDNKCEMLKYNCENNEKYNVTDLFICKQSFSFESESVNNINITSKENYEIKDKNVTNIVVINGNMLGKHDDVNDTIDTFFAASHVFDLPVKEVEPLNTRRKLLKYAGPVKVFVPWIVKPKNISNDTFHRPTLSSCYHKCPTKCPDTYAPVCGVPGIVAREPSIMFQNHCFMDVAQCKMFWEGKSSTAHSSCGIIARKSESDGILEKSRELLEFYRHTYSDFGFFHSTLVICSRKVAFDEVELLMKTRSGHHDYIVLAYVEASFLFCMGDEMNAVYRFLPAIRTLQHMGRLKKKGKFRAKLRNFRYLSDFRSGRPKFMG